LARDETSPSADSFQIFNFGRQGIGLDPANLKLSDVVQIQGLLDKVSTKNGFFGGARHGWNFP
jgi:hypothetical protein